MADKSVTAFLDALVNCDQEMTVWPADWNKTLEKYVPAADQDEKESEEEK